MLGGLPEKFACVWSAVIYISVCVQISFMFLFLVRCLVA